MVALEPLMTEAEQATVEAELAAGGKGRLMHRERADEAIVRELTELHLRYTGSTLALELLDNWEEARRKFVKVFPHEYKRALSEMFVKRAVAAGTAAKKEREAA